MSLSTPQRPRPPREHPPLGAGSAPGAPRDAAAPGRRPFARLPWRIGPADREVLWLYLLTRVGIWTTAYCTRWLFPDREGTRHAGSFFSSWQRWDWWHYLHIAQQGYFPDGSGPGTPEWDNREAFFPGFPFLLRAVHTVVPSWAAAGALISLVAGGVAVLALARIARLHLPQAAGQRAALFFLLSPCAVFLAAGYTEALFLALALPAWLAAQRLDWTRAAVLTCLATTVRVSGLFLAAALTVHFLVTARSPAQWRRLPWLALPALPPFLYSWYLHAHTADWMAWKHAEERGWYRDFHAPWEAWRNTWHAAFGHSQATGYALMCQAELLTMLVGVVLCGLLLRRRRWAEAAYIALSLWALGTSYWYTSIPRATLLWWPLWTGLAAWSLRSPRVRTAYLVVAAPLMTVFAVTFLSGRWAG
ncbi:mannosyltransferase family protein [Streptomyces sp. JV185]|uniref:mannosyltransferase family protein n=1 Tax=Streptomyces sp. JV185 TaxID=858638 RepID=UPI003FA69C16